MQKKIRITFSPFLNVALTSEFEVVRPIGMDSVCFSRVPTREGSFGPTPRSSSEGFLGTFTPRVWRILFNPLDFLSEYFSKGSFHFDFSDRAPTTAGIYPIHWSSGLVSSYYQVRETGPSDWYSWLILPVGRLDTISYESNPLRYRGEVLRFEAMNPRPRGILEPLNPTDEALKEGRNTTIEKVLRRLTRPFTRPLNQRRR